MLYFTITNQTLAISGPPVAGGSLDYLEAECRFTPDWDGLVKWAHFRLGQNSFDVALTNDAIPASAHLNLTAGVWQVCLHGDGIEGGQVTRRVTTDTALLPVRATGTLEGEPLPEIEISAAEQILATAQSALDLAQSVVDRADAGEFRGEKGDPGDVGTASWSALEDKPDASGIVFDATEEVTERRTIAEAFAALAASAVPDTRSVNGHALSADITLSAADIPDGGETVAAAIDRIDAAIGDVEAALEELRGGTSDE